MSLLPHLLYRPQIWISQRSILKFSELGVPDQSLFDSSCVLAAGPERMFVRVHDAVAHCAALAVRSDDLGHPPMQNGQNGHSHAQYIVGSVPGWREGSSDMNQPLLVHESIDNA